MKTVVLLISVLLLVTSVCAEPTSPTDQNPKRFDQARSNAMKEYRETVDGSRARLSDSYAQTEESATNKKLPTDPNPKRLVPSPDTSSGDGISDGARGRLGNVETEKDALLTTKKPTDPNPKRYNP